MSSHQQRFDWVDVTKGLTIVLVVTMHSTLGVQLQLDVTGYMDQIIQFGKSHRMPVFFAVAGLFLARSITKPWRTFIDKKILHFMYFYVLWSFIQIGIKAASGSGLHDVGWAQIQLIPIEPFGTIWFIYILPFYFLATRLLSRGPWWFMTGVAAFLFLMAVDTEIYVVDLFCRYYIYFVTGYICSKYFFGLALFARRNAFVTLSVSLLFILLNIIAMLADVQERPVFALPLGLFGIIAIFSLCSLISNSVTGQALKFCGRNSLYIYVSFFLPMAVSRIVIIKTGFITNVDLISISVVVITICSTILMHSAARWTGLHFLYEKPSFLRIKDEGLLLKEQCLKVVSRRTEINEKCS